MTAQVHPGTRRRYVILIAFLFLVVAGVTPVMAEWSHETVGSMYAWDSGRELIHTPVSLAVGSDNNPRISYLDADQHLAYAEWNGKKWITTTVDGTTKAGASSLAVGIGDSPGISYYDATKHALKYAKSNGAIWEIGNVEGGEAGSYNALALDSSNYPWISEYDAGSQRLKSSHWTGKSWIIDGVEGGTAGQYTCIALTAAGNPVIGLYDEHAGNGRLKYVYWDGTRWNVDHVVEEGQVGRYASLAIDKNDVLHFSYYDENNKALKYAYGKLGQEFTTSTVDSGDVGMYTSIALDEDNVPHISYWDAGHRSLKYAVVKPGNPWAADGWTRMTIPCSSGAWFGAASSLAIGPDGIPRIAYLEHTTSSTRLMYGKFYPTTADFTFSPASGPAPLAVSFTDTTTNGTHNTWIWDFGDGSASTNQNPTHTFTSEGTYKVKLTVSNAPETLSSTRVKPVSVLSQSNVRVFGDPYQLTLTPTHSDYQSLGGASAIRRDGSIETFVGGENLSGNDWVQVTRGAAIKKDGNLVTWTDGVIPAPTYAAAALSSSSTASGKKYVQVSQYSDWILAIYEDDAGATHLETRGNSADHPDVFSNVPSGTGWIMVAAGNDHALAVRSDGTLAAWGNNTYGQLDLPTEKVYSDIAAGEDFSIGLTQESAGTGGYIKAAGKNDYNQVTGIPKPQDAYIHVAAGTSTGAALGPHGQIILWGKTLPGIQPSSTEMDFTDISLGATWGLAIKEPAEEIHLTGPLSPGQPIPNSDGANLILPMGATLEHTDNDVTRIFAPNGTLIGWVNDDESGNYLTTQGLTKSSFVHVLPAASTIVPDEQTGIVTIESPLNGQMIMRSIIHHSIAIQSSSIPSGICYSNTDCGITDTIGNETYLSQPFSISSDYVPRFAINISGDTVVGTFCEADKAGNCIDKQAIVTHKKMKLGSNNPLRVGLTHYSSHSTTPSDSLIFVASCYPIVQNPSGRKIDGTTYCVGGVEPAILWSSSGGIAKYIDDTHQIIKKVFDKKECANSNACTLSGSWTADASDTYFHYSNTVVTLPAGSTVPQWILPAISGNIVVS